MAKAKAKNDLLKSKKLELSYGEIVGIVEAIMTWQEEEGLDIQFLISLSRTRRSLEAELEDFTTARKTIFEQREISMNQSDALMQKEGQEKFGDDWMSVQQEMSQEIGDLMKTKIEVSVTQYPADRITDTPEGRVVHALLDVVLT